MKVLQVNVVYSNGSTGKIVKEIHNHLISDGYESIVCFGRGDESPENNVIKLAPEYIMKAQSMRSKITGYAYSGCKFSTDKLIEIITKQAPDIVHLQCINGYMVNIYRLLDFLKRKNIITVITLHAEFMYTAGCSHAYDCEKWKSGCGHCPQKGNGRPSSKLFDRSAEEWNMMNNAFDSFENLTIVSVSTWLNSRAKLSPFFIDKNIKVILNGIDTNNIFKPTKTDSLKNKHRISDEKIILHVTPNFNSEIKGGKHVLELAERLKNERVKFIIVGYNADRENLPSNIIPVGHTKNQEELAEYYSLADLTLLTSKAETFSMVTAESLACGTPVIGFKAGGPESISIEEFSEFVEQGNSDKLYSVVKEWLGKNIDKNIIAKIGKERYSVEVMYKKYLDLYRGLIK